jgi:hypothetical protein
MAEFAEYYLDFLWNLLKNIGEFFGIIFSAFAKIFTEDIQSYISSLTEASANFGVLGWIAFILVTAINLLLVFFLIYRLAQLIRRYILFRGREVEKDELIEQVARLKKQVEQLNDEKAKILGLKMDKIGALADKGEEGKAAAENGAAESSSRFAKLSAIDDEYANKKMPVRMEEKDKLSLRELVENFRNFAASELKLYYDINTVKLFISAMATSKIIILEGISGTGKTSLPYAMARFFNNNAALISVQPSWRDRAELLGYLNEFTKKFNETEFLARVYEATYREDLNFIVLDEMNLARIEYYFAEFLSVMEMPDISEWKIDLVSNYQSDDPKNLINGKLLVAQNLWFIGTANQDDSTFTITDKVYDRAVSISIDTRGQYFDAPLTGPVSVSYDYIESLFIKAQNGTGISAENLNKIGDFDEFIQDKFKISFGNRILKQIKLFVPVYVACGGDELDALDFMIRSKVLRKLASLNLVFLENELKELSQFFDRQFGRGKFKLCQEYIRQLQKNI